MPLYHIKLQTAGIVKENSPIGARIFPRAGEYPAHISVPAGHTTSEVITVSKNNSQNQNNNQSGSQNNSQSNGKNKSQNGNPSNGKNRSEQSSQN